MASDYVFVSESVTAGHPDKLCDRISDAIVDQFLAQDSLARVDAECAVASGILFIASRFAATVAPDLVEVARRVIAASGYTGEEFNARDCTVMTTLREAEDRPRARADEAEMSEAELDKLLPAQQVTVFGFACRQTENLMPLPIYLARRLARALDSARENGEMPYLHPDGKVQVAVAYEDGVPTYIHSLAISPTGEENGVGARRLHDDIMDAVVGTAFLEQPLQPERRTRIHINPGGVLREGGPSRHAGLTGRKTAIDTYGEYSRQSGSALSGKDPLRIDRVGAYAARWAAKNVVAAGLADACEVQLSYGIGRAKPISVQARGLGTSALDDSKLTERVASTFDFRLGGILKAFGLRRLAVGTPGGFFEHLATYGQIGREDLDLPWETLDRVELLRG
ncbi:MAG: methionine adenosyltransferase [Gammaproteobacteria bacterium]